MKEKKTNKGTDGSTRERSKRLIIISVSVFIGLVLLFGIVLGTVSIIRTSSAAMSYRGATVSLPVANYLASVAKYNLMTSLASRGVEVEDTPEFWASSPEGENTTYGLMLRSGTEEYIRRVLVGSYLFDKNTSLTKADKESIKNATAEILDYKAGNSKAQFNELTESMGFDYADFEKAAHLIYKYEMSQSVIFGFDGAALAGGGFAEECNEFFSTYTRAKLIFIRTRDHYAKNEETGKDELIDYTDGERAEIEAGIAEIDALITAKEMTESRFDAYLLSESEKDGMNVKGGYYLAPTSHHTYNLSLAYPDVVKSALGMKEGEYARVDTEWGVCFIYKCEREAFAYALGTNSMFFADFYSDAADYLYDREIAKYTKDVKVSDKFRSVDFVALPYNYDLVLSFKS